MLHAFWQLHDTWANRTVITVTASRFFIANAAAIVICVVVFLLDINFVAIEMSTSFWCCCWSFFLPCFICFVLFYTWSCNDDTWLPVWVLTKWVWNKRFNRSVCPTVGGRWNYVPSGGSMIKTDKNTFPLFFSFNSIHERATWETGAIKSESFFFSAWICSMIRLKCGYQMLFVFFWEFSQSIILCFELILRHPFSNFCLLMRCHQAITFWQCQWTVIDTW